MATASGTTRSHGSAREGASTWMVQRLTAIALVPLGLWFVASAVSLSGADHAAVAAWLARPLNTTGMLLLIVTVFWHAQLGVQVIIEDYVHHDGTKLGGLMAANFALIAVGLACVVAVLKVSLGS